MVSVAFGGRRLRGDIILYCMRPCCSLRMQPGGILLGQIHTKRQLHQQESILPVERSCQSSHRFHNMESYHARHMASESEHKAEIDY